jgi:lysosomal alpha-mannosidase
VRKFNLVVEVHQVFNSWLSQTIRLFQNATEAEFEWQVGPIDVDDGNGREVIVKFDSDLESNSLFYTDANGREVLQRRRNHRPSWPFFQTEKVAGNYFPVNSRIFIRDENSAPNPRQLTLVTDRSQGGSSIKDGSIELMLHRRLLDDDSKGVGEHLNEVGVDGKGLIVKGKVYMTFDSVEASASLHRELAHRVNNRPLLLFSADNSDSESFDGKLTEWSALDSALPANLHLLTLTRDFEDDDKSGSLHSIIVRIEHFYEKNEDSVLSLPVTVRVDEIFAKQFNVTNVQELSLGANMRVEELNERLKWKAEQNDLSSVTSYSLSESEKVTGTFEFSFSPMQIRTFRIWYFTKPN